MWFGKRGPRSSNVGLGDAFVPRTEPLENRLLMAIDVGGVVPTAAPPANVPNIATKPYGVQEAGTNGSIGAGGGLGYATALLGDVTGFGYESALVGQPVVNNSPSAFNLFAQQYNKGTAFLALGSENVTTGTTPNWLALPKDPNRVGTMTQVGTTPQTSPLAPNPTINAYDGVQFTTSSATDGLGWSVADAGLVNSSVNNLDDFLIGAPGIDTAYLVLGSPNLVDLTSRATPGGLGGGTFPLDNPPVGTGITVIAINNGAVGGNLGQTVAGLPNVLGISGDPGDIAIAAPHTVNADGSVGAIYVVSDSSLMAYVTAHGDKVNGLDGLIAAGTILGVKITLTKSLPSDVISISAAGDFDSDGHPDFLIGTPGNNILPPATANPTGAAYLIYGVPSTAPFPTSFSLSNVGDPGAGPEIRGAVFTGNTNYRTGWTVGIAGTNQGFSEITIGSPGAGNFDGEVTLVYGGLSANPAVSLPANRLLGTFNIDSAGVFVSATFQGVVDSTLPPLQQPLAGYGLSSTFSNSSAQTVDILIGAPGEEPYTASTTNIGQGAVFVIPIAASSSSPPILGKQSLDLTTVESSALKALIIEDTNGKTATSQPDISFGASVSGILPLTTPIPGSVPGQTIDGDTTADFLIGAPLDSTGSPAAAGQTTSYAGSLFVIEGALLPSTSGGSSSGAAGGPLPPGVAQNITGLFYPLVAATTSFGNDVFVPTPSALSKLSYKPIPKRVAYYQYLPDKGFTERTLNYFYPNKYHYQRRNSSNHHNYLGQPDSGGVYTLGNNVFTRSKFSGGHPITFTHKTPVIPTNLQTEKLPAPTHRLPKKN